MVTKKNKFSAFKLFYDEFVYKKNNSVSYLRVEHNIDKIRDITFDIRKMPKFNVELYMVRLERANKRLKEQLEEILNLDKKFLEFYKYIYKNHMSLSNDKVEDMPFIICTSFYDDYRLDNKTFLELETSSYIVPKSTSLDKKEIRNEAKGLTRFEYFIKLIKNGENVKQYAKFINKSNYMLGLVPTFKETSYSYNIRIENEIPEYEYLWNRIEEKAKKCADYEVISEKMCVAFKKKFFDWNNEFNSMIKEYYDALYKKVNNELNVKGKFNAINDLSFETFKESCDKLVDEKEKLVILYDKGKFINYKSESENYLNKFKEVLINSFFDTRFRNPLNNDSGVKQYVERAIQLYGLAYELDDLIFERILFDASHSADLKRGNDVRGALIAKLYDLYNPQYLLSIYEKARLQFEQILDSNDDNFRKQYTTLLIDKKVEYDYHGPMPTMNSIQTKILERKKEFICEHCISDLFSRDVTEYYDTRDYDLNVLAKDISVNDMVLLYYRIKHKIETFNFDSSVFNDVNLYGEDYEKKRTLEAAQEFVVTQIYSKLKLKCSNELQKVQKYSEICKQYLKENILFKITNEDDSEYAGMEKFIKVKNEFNKKSLWNKFITDNKIK